MQRETDSIVLVETEDVECREPWIFYEALRAELRATARGVNFHLQHFGLSRRCK